MPALKRTPLYQAHVQLGARLVPFSGWDMPVQYAPGVLAEHHAVRERAGLFDIGHMGQFGFHGPDALEFLQWVTTHDVSRLEIGAAQYSLLCNDAGGVLDDIVVYRLDELRYLMVVNAGNTDTDYAWISGQLAHPGRGVKPQRVSLSRCSPPQTLLAIQGPRATRVLNKLTTIDVGQLANYHAVAAPVDRTPAMIARTGYTGERGYELFFAAKQARKLWDALLDAGKEEGLLACGLGARDTLRLEAGMALYSHELTTATNPFEAGLERVVRFEKGDFIGSAALSAVRAEGLTRKLAGIELIDRGVPRPGYPILWHGQAVGTLTSGGPSPTLKKSVGMGYLPLPLATEGAEVAIDIRGRPHAARVVRLPFYRRERQPLASPAGRPE